MDFRLRRKWNILRSSKLIVSMDYTENNPNEKPSIIQKLKGFYEKNEVTIQIIIIFAGNIGIVLEGSYSRKF